MCTRNQESEKEKSIIEFYNRDTFVKVKEAFAISKIVFSFVKWDIHTGESITSVDCYMKVEEAGLLARKITTGRMYQKMEQERAKGQKYPDSVWKSPLGGVSEAEVKRRKLRSDGRAISRHFTIAPGSSKYAVISAITCAGDTDETGLIIPDLKDPNKNTIRIALSSHDEIEELGIMLEAAVNAYVNYVCNIYKPRRE